MAFLNDAMDLQLSPDEVATLEARTEGWVAGLHLAALTLRARSPQYRHDFITALGGTHRYILDYLAGEVFDRQPPDVQRFLLHTSILGGLNGELCDAVLGGPATLKDGQAVLERLDEANLFVVRLDDTRTWYRYHHLFAGFLRQRLRREQPDPTHTLSLALIAQGRVLQTQMLQGRFDLASTTYRQALASAENHGMSDSPAIGVAQVYMAEILGEWNDLPAAEGLVRTGIARCREWPGLAEMALDGYVTRARVLQARGDADGALAALHAAEALGRDARVSQYAERIALARVRLWLATGDEAALRRWARARQSAWQAEEKLGYVGLLERIMLARLHLVHSRPDETLAVLHHRHGTQPSQEHLWEARGP